MYIIKGQMGKEQVRHVHYQKAEWNGLGEADTRGKADESRLVKSESRNWGEQPYRKPALIVPFQCGPFAGHHQRLAIIQMKAYPSNRSTHCFWQYLVASVH
jgi:hypothetical protein